MIGLVLAMLGLTGAILVHRDAWIAAAACRPTRGSPIQPRSPQATERLLADPAKGRRASSMPVTLRAASCPAKGAGAYADQAGTSSPLGQPVGAARTVAVRSPPPSLRWRHGRDGDRHRRAVRRCCSSSPGRSCGGARGRTFKFRLWPRRLSRPAILMQHRDLGIVVAPLLLLSLYTGTMMIFRPVAVVGPSRPGSPPLAKSLEAPKSGAASANIPTGPRSSAPRMPVSPMPTIRILACRASPATRSRSG
jgi:hypothetical protein